MRSFEGRVAVVTERCANLLITPDDTARTAAFLADRYGRAAGAATH